MALRADSEGGCTDKKQIKIFLIYKEIQNRAVAKSYMTNGLLIYGEIFAHFLIYSTVLGSPSSYITLQLLHSSFTYTVYEENFIFFFVSVEPFPTTVRKA